MKNIFFHLFDMNSESVQYIQMKKNELLFEFKSLPYFYVLIDEKYFLEDLNHDISIFSREFLKKQPHFKEGHFNRLWTHLSSINNGVLYKDEEYLDNEIFNKTIKYNNSFFDNCKFYNKNEENTDLSSIDTFNKYYFHNCSFKNLSITLFQKDWRNLSESSQQENQKQLGQKFNDCTFEKLMYSSTFEHDYLYINKNIYIKHLLTDSTDLKMLDVDIHLFEHKSITNNSKWIFEGTNIIYDEELVKSKKISSYDNLQNTYEYLHKNPGLFSQSKIIKKYLNYFSSRKNGFHKSWFWLNEGYTNWKKPILLIFFTVLFKFIVINCFNTQLEYYGNELNPVFYPYTLIKNIIMNNISFTPNLLKWILIPIEILYILSTFSLITYLKREFGFGKIQE